MTKEKFGEASPLFRPNPLYVDKDDNINYGCPNCGVTLAPKTKVCPSCGVQINFGGAPLKCPSEIADKISELIESSSKGEMSYRHCEEKIWCLLISYCREKWIETEENKNA